MHNLRELLYNKLFSKYNRFVFYSFPIFCYELRRTSLSACVSKNCPTYVWASRRVSSLHGIFQYSIAVFFLIRFIRSSDSSFVLHLLQILRCLISSSAFKRGIYKSEAIDLQIRGTVRLLCWLSFLHMNVEAPARCTLGTISNLRWSEGSTVISWAPRVPNAAVIFAIARCPK
jgi:hypothetical protein